MIVITVSGSRSRVGKTTLCSLLLARLDGFAAIKVATGGMYTSITDVEEVVDEEGKDTHVMKVAGACPVVLVHCPAEDVAAALEQAFVLVGDTRGVIIEGNSPARRLDPDVAFFVTGPEVADAKPGALELLKKADVVVVNTEDKEPPAKTEADIRALNALASITTMGRIREGCPELDELADAV